MDKVHGEEAYITSTHHTQQTAFQTKFLIHQSMLSAAPACETSGTETVCARLCVCQVFPEFISNCAEQMAHCDMAEWFYGGLYGATVTVTNCAYRPPLDKDHITDGLGARARRGRHRS